MSTPGWRLTLTTHPGVTPPLHYLTAHFTLHRGARLLTGGRRGSCTASPAAGHRACLPACLPFPLASAAVDDREDARAVARAPGAHEVLPAGGLLDPACEAYRRYGACTSGLTLRWSDSGPPLRRGRFGPGRTGDRR
jgi:hypothetical protein